MVSPRVIDQIGIAPATHLAMQRAIAALPCTPDFLLVDGREKPRLPIPLKSIIDGDALVISVAAASIVAKVYRDRLMERLDACCAGWGFAQHKGYGTPLHLEALQRLGPSPAHRRSFAPLRQLPLFTGGVS